MANEAPGKHYRKDISPIKVVQQIFPGNEMVRGLDMEKGIKASRFVRIVEVYESQNGRSTRHPPIAARIAVNVFR